MSFSWKATNLNTKTLVFIDANVEGYQYLASGVLDQVEVRILNREQNGIVAITTELQKFAAISGAIDAIHIFSHGSPGEVQLGSSTLNAGTLQEYKSCFQQWQSCLGDEADLLIYGCNVAAGDGVGFVQQLSELTGANVAASVDLTGSGAKGGNWNLEVTTGEITATGALKPEVMASYEGVLAILTVTTAADDNNPGSLRNVIAQANSGDTIAFNSSLANQTITLTQGEIRINPGKNITIDGASAANLSISGNNASRVFLIDANVGTNTNATIKNLKIINGYVNANAGAAPTNNTTIGRGGAIAGADQATLTVENVEFNNNVADKGGGAIYMAWNSNLSVNNSKFKANKAIAGNDERGAGAIAFVSAGNLTVRNSDFNDNKGIVGGAINSLNGKLTVENSNFINNDTESAFFDTGKSLPFLRGYGGAIYTDRASSSEEESQGIGGTIRIIGSVFDNNRAKAGGGATHLFTSPTDNIIIENSTYTNNQVSTLVGGEIGDGGGLYQISNVPNRGMIIRNTTFANNTAVNQGGGLRMTNAPTEITNSTFSGNKLTGNTTSVVGGGMVTYGAPVTVTNSTFADNEAYWVGGGIATSPDSTVTLKNTIFSNNTAQNQFGVQQQTSGKFIDAGNNLQTAPDPRDQKILPTFIVGDPKLATLQEVNGFQVRPLQAGSAAIDAGTGAGAPNTDQRGVTRPIDGDGNGSAVVDIGSYEFSGDVGTQAPEIEVKNGTTDIVDGTTTPINFGNTTVGTPVVKTFTINNTGTSELSLTAPTLPTGFTIVGNFPSTVAAKATANFQLQLDAAAAGNPTGSISFANNDSDENPFDFAIAGIVNPVVVPTPEIAVLDGTTDIVDGTTTPINFGNTTVGTPVVKTFTINNTGTSELSLTAPTLPTGFTLVGNFPSTVAAKATANFQLQLDAAAAGNPTGSISFANNDSDENPFDFAIAGIVNPVVVPTPEIAVLDGTTDIVDGTTTPINFGNTTVGTPVVKTFTINNTGAAELSLTAPTLPTGFTLVGNFPSTVAAKATANFQLQLDAAAAGNPTGSISFANNDSDENPFDFAIAGIVNPVPNLRPTITNVTSTASDGKYTVGQVIPINVIFSEKVVVNGTPQLVLETGAVDAVVNFSSGSGTNTLTFNYKVGATDKTPDLDYRSRTALNLNQGIIEDADGNNAVLTLPRPGTAGSLGANKAIEIPAFNIIAGTNRRDVLTGTNESDRIIGEQGNDRLTGGGGADEFVYSSIQDRFDTITDFQVGSDKIVMTNLLASFGYSGSNPIADGIVSFASRGSNTLLLLDPDGADGSALARPYITFRNVSVTNLNNSNNFVFS